MASLPSTPRAINRSFGMKLVLIILLALFLMIPTIFVSMLVSERAERSRSVASDNASASNEAQTTLAPAFHGAQQGLSHAADSISSPAVAKTSVNELMSE